MADHNEVVFESEICAYLEAHGWLYSANDTGYDRERALFPEDLFGVAGGDPAERRTRRR